MIVVRMADKTSRALRAGLTTFSFSVFILIPVGPVVAQQIVTSGQVESGILSVPGPQPSPWDVGFLLNVGRDAQGELIIRDGGVAFLTRVDLIVTRMVTEAGGDLGGIGSVLVTGAGSSFDYGHQMLIGGAGTGSLVVENGARVFDAGADFNGDPAATAIGSEVGGSGTVRVDGTGSLWEAGSRLSVGIRGAGSLDIIAGGRVSTDTVVAIARFPEANGTVTIRGANSVLDPGRFCSSASAGVVRSRCWTVPLFEVLIGLILAEGLGYLRRISQPAQGLALSMSLAQGLHFLLHRN
ncbi:hypothetical protein [Candidatus Phyllobacterium onerii]|uniref:hypothetical protein n=1 Tax=Candidatus Phyllobacterium onerii TaxID=3020828 RepID=UPI00232BFC84|nr:hypothetical protein [Phyllobacterium sp. IY22]